MEWAGAQPAEWEGDKPLQSPKTFQGGGAGGWGCRAQKEDTVRGLLGRGSLTVNVGFETDAGTWVGLLQILTVTVVGNRQ